MANDGKEKKNRVREMEVPWWVTGYYKWTAIEGIVGISTMMVLFGSFILASIFAPMENISLSDWSVGFGVILLLCVGLSLGYVSYGTPKRKKARAYAKEELIAILGIKEDHYCKVTVELGLAHLAHVIRLSIPCNCNADLILGGFAKARALALMEFDFPTIITTAQSDEIGESRGLLSREALCCTHPLDPTVLSEALDNKWISIARCLTEAQQMRTGSSAT